MPEAGEQPASEKGPSLAKFYVAIGIVVALVGLGALLYRPLRLRYALYKAEHNPYSPRVVDGRSQLADEWLVLCLDAADGGNSHAMELVINRYWVGILVKSAESGDPALLERKSIALLAAKAQPRLFFEVLGRGDDRKVLAVLQALLSDKDGFFWAPEGSGEPRALLVKWAALAKSSDPEVARLGAAATEFLRQRFKLAEGPR